MTKHVTTYLEITYIWPEKILTRRCELRFAAAAALGMI
jgi:hypothetical protein